MLIQTERLTIRPVEPDDWRSIQAIWQDFQSSIYAQYDMPHSIADEDVRTRIERWSCCHNSGTEHMFFAVCLQSRVIGYIAFNQREDAHEIGYCFHSDAHGKGYAAESHLALFQYLSSLGLERFIARTALQNTPSMALLRTLGFQQTGREDVSFYQDDQGGDIVFKGGIFERAAQKGCC